MALRSLLSIALSFLFIAPTLAQLPVSTSSENKNVILEEFTGYKCTWCPDGHKKANDFKSNNPGDVFLVNVHTGGYASPDVGDPDYRTSFGSALANQSNLSGYPAGTINRHFFSSYNQNGGTAMSRGDWSDAGNQILGQSAYANVALEGTVDVQNRELTVDVEVYFTSDGAQDNNLNVALTQDSIRGPQKAAHLLYPSHVNNKGEYLHMHMLRHFLTGQWGDVINNTSSGNLVSRQYTYNLPSDINGVPLELGDLNILAYLDTGQQEIINGNDGPITYVNFSNSKDVAVESIEGPDEVCPGAYDGTVIVKNQGSEPVSSISFEYDMNGGNSSTFTWNGYIDTLDRKRIELPTHSFSPNSTNTFNVNVTGVNGGTDGDASDNSMSKSGIQKTDNTGSGTDYVFTVFQDRYGSETTWEFMDASGNTVASGGPYTDYGQDTSLAHRDTFTVSNPECYKFKIYDAYGDGINSVYGNGSYSLTTKEWSDTIFSSDGNYYSEDLRFFEVTSMTSVKEEDASEKGLTVYPNPVSQQNAYLEIEGLQKSVDGRVEVIDLTGRVVHKQEQVRASKGRSRFTIDVGGFESGMYTVRFITEDRSFSERFSVVDR